MEENRRNVAKPRRVGKGSQGPALRNSAELDTLKGFLYVINALEPGNPTAL